MAVLNLRVENGSFAYPGGPVLFHDIAFEAGSGEILAILGPNGAGKTTLLRCIMGILRWKSGRSLLDGADIGTMPEREQWRHMSYVPQARSASGIYTAFQTVLLGRSARLGAFRTPKAEDLEAAEQAMERLGIADLGDKRCAQLSGGELQMVLIARALASDPELLILDEPESNLDFRNQLIVLDAVTKLARDGMACVFNTHYPAHALQRAHKSLLLYGDGRSICGRTDAVITEDSIRSAFGVNAVIGEVETPQNILQNVMAVSLAGEQGKADKDTGREDRQDSGSPDSRAAGRCVAAINIITKSNAAAEEINALLHEYRDLLLGRMGMPHREAGLYLICVTVDGESSRIRELTHRLTLIPGVSAKTTFA